VQREGNLAGDNLTVTGKRAEDAMPGRWPGIDLKVARRKVTRLRTL